MGYYSKMEGSFTVTPPPPITLFKRDKLDKDRDLKWGLECINVNFEKETSTEVEPDGTVVTRTKAVGLTIEACGERGHKHYYAKEALQELVNQLGRDRKYEGNFHLIGEDGEQWGYAIRDGVVRDLKPTITWNEE